MSGENGRLDSQKSRQELLDEIYYLRDVAGEREQQVRLLQARIERMPFARLWRWKDSLCRLARRVRRAESSGGHGPTKKNLIGGGGSTGDTRLPTSQPPAVESRDRGKHHLYVDVTALALRGGRTGVQRVTREITRALLADPPDRFAVRPVYAAPGQPYRVLSARHSREGGNPVASYANRSKPLDLGRGCDYSEISSPMDARAGDMFLGLDHSLQAVVERESDLDRMRKQGVRIWFLCNDILPLDHPEWFPPDVPAKFQAWLQAILRSADGVACISRTTQVGVSRWFDAWNTERGRRLELGHFGLGADPVCEIPNDDAVGEEEATLLGRLRGQITFLMVGTLEPRKGHAQALEAFNRLWANGEDVTLVIAGLPGWMTEVTQRRIRHHEEFGKRLFWFMDASDALLEKLYATCTVLLAPSEGEGFGLPLVEAARHGLPILCRDLPVFREVAGAHAIYFEGRDPGALAGAIRAWMDAWKKSDVPDSRGLRCLTWAESARELMDLVLGAPVAASPAPDGGATISPQARP